MDTPVGPTVACIGGGQLGRMLGLAALPLGIRMEFVDPVEGAPAGEIGPLHIGELDERGVIGPCLDRATAVTYEWEGVPAEIVSWIEEMRTPPVFPPAAALRASQDRLHEKTLFRQLGIGTPDFLPVDSLSDLEDAIAKLGTPAVLKTRRGGYDGKGQFVLRVPGDAPPAWAALGGVPLILEAFVPFDRELSVLAVRGRDGSTECWPVVENQHSEGMLRVSMAPAPGLTAELQAAAVAIATRMLDELLRRRWAPARQRDGAPGPQQRALDHRRGGHQPVREPHPGRRRLAAREHGGSGREHHAQLHRHHARTGRRARGPRRAPPRLRQVGPPRPEAGARHDRGR
jgi:phosphoribosylaminoimidazole carboxylase (NCAIR synthetase)